MDPIDYCFNPHLGQFDAAPSTDHGAWAFHRSLPDYASTPLVALPALANQLGLHRILVKDESRRFGVNSFKALGASFAIFRMIQERYRATHGASFAAGELLTRDWPALLGSITLATATDGNHGRAVAWMAAQLRLNCIVFVPDDMIAAREEAIARFGAEVRRVPGGFDEASRRCELQAEAEGWEVVSDTSRVRGNPTAEWIAAGYETLFREIESDLDALGVRRLDCVFIQAGVGGLAAACGNYFGRHFGSGRPRLVCVEPLAAACILASVKKGDGQPLELAGIQDSIMTGLNCAAPSVFAWPILKAYFDFFLAIPDPESLRAMRLLYHARPGDPRIVSGESGAVGLAGLLALQEPDHHEIRSRLGLCHHANVLIINTEGMTDPDRFKINVTDMQAN